MWKKLSQITSALLCCFVFFFLFSLKPVFAADDFANCFCWYYPDGGDPVADMFCLGGAHTDLSAACEAGCLSLADDYLAVVKQVLHTNDETQAADYEEICYRYPAPTTTAAAATTTGSTETYEFVAPELAVTLDPNFKFSPILSEGGIIKVTYLSEYIQMIYNYLLGVMSIVVIIMVMIRGVQYLTAGSSGRTKEATKGIRGVVWGFALLLCSYTLLKLVNPELMMFRALELEEVTTVLLPYGESEAEFVDGTVCSTTRTPSGSTIQANGKQLCTDMATSIEAAASALAANGYGMMIADGFRTPEKQIEQINIHCKNPPGSKTCDSKDGVTACPMFEMNPKNCPHTTGAAVDAWGATLEGGAVKSQCITQKTCLMNLSKCVENPCQKALIDAMKAQDFCMLSGEPWHFEKPKMSTTCN